MIIQSKGRLPWNLPHCDTYLNQKVWTSILQNIRASLWDYQPNLDNSQKVFAFENIEQFTYDSLTTFFEQCCRIGAEDRRQRWTVALFWKRRSTHQRWISVALSLQRRSGQGMIPARHLPTRRDLWCRPNIQTDRSGKYCRSGVRSQDGVGQVPAQLERVWGQHKELFQVTGLVPFPKGHSSSFGRLAGNCGWMRSTQIWAWRARTVNSSMCTSSSSLLAVHFSRWLAEAKIIDDDSSLNAPYNCPDHPIN